MKVDQLAERVTIGKILKARGIRGDMKVLPLTDIPGRFESLGTVCVQMTNTETRRFEIEHVSYYKNFVYLRFKGCDSIEAIRPLLGSLLQVDRSESPELPEGLYYHFEILDADVYTDDNRYLGKVVDILETCASDIYVVRNGKQEYLIPSNPEVVTEIDREGGKICVHPLEGLLDL
ncbi:16S rRNA processing protein RimM [candidate division KSB3 bacterium]|uniref:Ribosome maturation factor RimM n=1 Tax=candidate division KSB3 bacterium TaxID=2044937 RepID=A0A2G6E4B2_9BACT|nr:MAG: 16S rRNA processing protein RimM [candidate division KSB3 bacterium]PIE29183.1 MAG: 16S rRNA processing protein RimM [candidate division KSB3 bacterium]